jgi:uncharacterized protein
MTKLSVNRLFAYLADLLVDHPRWVFLLVALLSVVAVIGRYDPGLLVAQKPQRSSDRFFGPKERALQKGNEKQAEKLEGSKAKNSPNSSSPDSNSVTPVRVTLGDVILVAESPDFFTPAGAAAMREIVQSLESLPYIKEILWLDKAPQLNIFSLPEPLLPRGDASPTRFEAAKKRALKHPLVGGQLLSLDTQTMLLMVRVEWLFVTSDADVTTRLTEVASEVAQRYPEAKFAFRVTGNAPIRLMTAATNRANEIKYQLIGYSVVLAMAVFMFRGFSAVVIVALAPTVGVFWTMGVLRLLDLHDNPFNTVVLPILLSMVGFTDGVHMMTHIRRHRAAGMSGKEAARCCVRDVGLACFLTSLTTAIGFGSLALAHHQVVRDFGTCCVIGVGLAFVAVITIIPLTCLTRLGDHVAAGYSTNWLDKNLDRISSVIDWVLDRHRQIAGLAMAVTLVFTAIALTLRPDERRYSALPATSEAAAALQHIDHAFGGMETSSVDVVWSEKVAADSPEVAEVLAGMNQALLAEPLIGQPLSIINLLQALPGEGDPRDRMSLLELLPPPLKLAFYEPQNRYAKISFRVQDLGIAKYAKVFERLEQQAQTLAAKHPEFTIDLSGEAVWRWRHLFRVVSDLATSLGTASIIIFVVLGIAYRSVRIGLISVVPNIFPLCATGTAMVFLGENLALVSVCAFTICLGIAVDDTIHFLTRFQEEQKKTDDDRVAIRQAFMEVGTGMIMTTVVLVVGFSTSLMSDSRDHRVFALMGIMTIGTALFADLIFLPALLLAWKKRSPRNAT